MAGFLSELNPFEQDETEPTIVQQSPDQEKRMTNIVDNATKSPSDIHQSNMQGVDQAGNSVWNSPGQQAQDNVRSGQENNGGMSAAIQNKYQQIAGAGIGRMKVQNEFESQMQSAQRLNQAHQMMYAKQQVDVQNYQRLMDAYNQKQAARAQMISSMLGVVGMGGGMAIAASHGKKGPSAQSTPPGPGGPTGPGTVPQPGMP